MHEETELSRDGRKQLAELARDYPQKSRQELTQTRRNATRTKREFTRLNCSRTFSSTIGKTNHIKQIPECKNVSQREAFGNKCRDCSRTLKEPVNLREHRQFVCADIRKTMPTQTKAKKRGNGEEKEEETEEPTAGPGNLNYVCDKQRQPNESGENAK